MGVLGELWWLVVDFSGLRASKESRKQPGMWAIWTIPKSEQRCIYGNGVLQMYLFPFDWEEF